MSRYLLVLSILSLSALTNVACVGARAGLRHALGRDANEGFAGLTVWAGTPPAEQGAPSRAEGRMAVVEASALYGSAGFGGIMALEGAYGAITDRRTAIVAVTVFSL